ncbi:MAG: mannose-1-phosphate guanylyltransferase, partial [Woeseiaceae bacterium]
YSPEIEALETAGGIINALHLLENDETPFVVINGDVFCDYDFSQLPQTLTGLAHLILVENPLQHTEGDFMLNPDGQVCAQGENKLTFSGIGVYQPQLFQGLNRGKRPLAPLLRQAMENSTVTGELYQGQWHDIGTPERLKALNLSK